MKWRRPTDADHAVIAPLLDEWWGGRPMRALLPRLFFANFASTSLVAEDDDGSIAGFIIAFVSQDQPDEGYIHFVGVAPTRRGTGLGAELYQRTFVELTARGCRKVKAITSPVNTGSIAFHKQMGFTIVSPPDDPTATAWPDYDSPGEARVIFTRDFD